ncbi:MAG: hypothetical protein AB7E24_23615, partial [Novosphingobium sp.]
VQASKGVEKLKDLRGFFPLNPGKDHLIPASHCLSRTKCPFTMVEGQVQQRAPFRRHANRQCPSTMLRMAPIPILGRI